MSPPDEPFGALKRRDDEPAFHEPWQAQALAMANLLLQSGAISGSGWAEALGTELRGPLSDGGQDDAQAYYSAVVRALERVLTEGKKVSHAELHLRRHEWEHAYLDTPHGQPVVLKGGRVENKETMR